MKPSEQLLLMIQLFYVIKMSSSAVKTSCINEYCFTASNPLVLNQGDALNWCQTNASKLIELTNSSIQSAMSSAFSPTEFSNYAFTGGKRVSQSWSWINGNGIGSLSPNDQIDGSYAYGYLMRQTSAVTLWARRPGDPRQGYICQGESTCSGANNGFIFGSSCYRSYREGLPWYSARNRCLVNGGDLATFDSITSNEGLRVINDAWLQQDVTYWIGIRKESWKWQTSDVTYSNWMSGHPITYTNSPPLDCLCVNPQSNWQWTECRCADKNSFICISPSALTTSTTTTSTTKPTTTTTTTTMTMQMMGDTSYERHEDIQLHPTADVISSSSTADLATRRSSDNYSQSPQTQDSFDIRVAIGIGVGVGAGIVVIAVVIVVIVIVTRKGCPKRKKKQKQQPLQTPDLISLQTIGNKAMMEESPYGTVIRQPGIGGGESMDDEGGEADATPNTIYADLQFLSQSFKDPRNKSMNLVNEITEPTESLSQPMEETERKKMENNGEQLQDTVTRA